MENILRAYCVASKEAFCFRVFRLTFRGMQEKVAVFGGPKKLMEGHISVSTLTGSEGGRVAQGVPVDLWSRRCDESGDIEGFDLDSLLSKSPSGIWVPNICSAT
jgi:hypothetical protein